MYKEQREGKKFVYGVALFMNECYCNQFYIGGKRKTSQTKDLQTSQQDQRAQISYVDR